MSKTARKSRTHTEKGFDEVYATESESDDDSSISDIKELFAKARHLLCPTAFYRQITYLYAERKLMVFFLVHLVSTLIIWCKLIISISQDTTTMPQPLIIQLTHSKHSPFCTSKARCTTRCCSGNCQPILVENHCTTTRVWFHACHSISNVLDSTNHGTLHHQQFV